MFNKTIVGETHARTVVKAAIYRVASIVSMIILTLILGGNWMQAVTMGFVSLIIGSLHYYAYERIWLWVGWQRNTQGQDSRYRSLIKAIVYRITVLMVMMISARMVFADTNLIAFALASLKFVTNALAYYGIERVFNNISWGKKPVDKT